MPATPRALLPLTALFLCAAIATAAAGPPPACDAPDDCEAKCQAGAGELPACTRLADALLHGRRVAVDRPRALELLTKACAIDADDYDAPTDPAACLALGQLRKDGWMFEIERTDNFRAPYTRAASRARCFDGDQRGCAVRARANLALAYANLAPGASLGPNAVKSAFGDAELGCTKGGDPDACLFLISYAYRAAEGPEAQRRIAAANAGLVAACVADDVTACLAVLDTTAPPIKAALERGCQAGDPRACGKLRYNDVLAVTRDPAKLKLAVAALLATCDGDGHDQCGPLASDLIYGRPGFVEADPPRGLALAARRCDLGDPIGCQVLASARGKRGPTDLQDEAEARGFADRACKLVGHDQFCPCDDPTVPSCVVRALYTDHQACERDEVGACVRVATHFRDGDGIDRDVARSANYLRRGCDAADKVACATLDEVCRDNPELPVELCQQSLIQSDLFFEAEFQAAAGGDVDMINPDATAGALPTPGAITVADVAANLPTGARRGHLDADLVVDVVLDRARQAAIKLVVHELLKAQKRAGYRYLQDLLDQGARLMADPTTMRREKFQDLGMTVVRAFVAANLIDGLYPTSDELRAAPEIGATVIAGAHELGTRPGVKLSADLHGHLVDVAYYWLGQTRLFGRSSSQSQDPPLCPFVRDHGVALCAQLRERAIAERAIGVAKVLDALRLVKLLRGGGFEDVRRLIEAASRSRTIANLRTTPGLNLQAWQDQIIGTTRERVGKMRVGLSDLRLLLRASVYADKGPGIDELIAAAASARTAIGPSSIRLAIGTDNIEQIYRVLRIIERAKFELGKAASGGPPAAGAPPPPPSALDPRTIALAKVRKDVQEALRGWGPRAVTETSVKLEALAASLDGIAPALTKLEAAVADVRGVFARFPGPDRKVSLDVGDLPLYATVDLTRELRTTAAALAALDDGLRAVFPGEVPARLRFARASTARLIAFLDLMQRVARQSPLSMRSGDVIAALRTLGTYRVAGFDAPLYDVLEPVLDALKTHEPMSLDLLFAVIGRVRLDTLIGSLQGRQNACTDDTSVDCWVTKLIHALQESVEKDGASIRVDGGKFAARLAQHGDDFRHKHTWRGYFHLTVGVGGLYSDPTDDLGSQRRPVPLISEQVGFGLASPSLLGDRVTFKVGAAASGILYRALLDSQESNAIMLHPILFALDVGDLVEAYVSPAMIMLYPPQGDDDGALRWGFSAGLSVPLSAYLEKL